MTTTVFVIVMIILLMVLLICCIKTVMVCRRQKKVNDQRRRIMQRQAEAHRHHNYEPRQFTIHQSIQLPGGGIPGMYLPEDVYRILVLINTCLANLFSNLSTWLNQLGLIVILVNTFVIDMMSPPLTIK